MGSLYSVTSHSTQVNTLCLNPSQIGWYSVYLHQKYGRLSWPRCLVTYRDGLHAHVLTQLSVEQLCWLDSMCYCYATPINVMNAPTWRHINVSNIFLVFVGWQHHSWQKLMVSVCPSSSKLKSLWKQKYVWTVIMRALYVYMMFVIPNAVSCVNDTGCDVLSGILPAAVDWPAAAGSLSHATGSQTALSSCRIWHCTTTELSPRT